MRKQYIYAIRNTSGANIDHNAPQKMTLMVASIKGEEDLDFKSVVEFEFILAELGESPMKIKLIHLPPKPMIPKITEMFEYRILECLKNVIIDLGVVFQGMDIHQTPTISEFVEICVKNKVAVLLKEVTPNIVNNVSKGDYDFTPISIVGSLIDDRVKSYRTPSN